MNVSSIHLYSVLDDPLATPVKHAELKLNNVSKSDSYIIKGVSGLDVDEVIHRYYATDSDTKYYNTTMPPRTVAIAIRLNPKYRHGETAEVLRNNLQKMISYTRSGLIEMRFMNGETHVSSLKGIITKFESSLFSAEPEVQITFKCDEPFFTGPTRITVPIGTARADSKTLTDNLSTAAHGFRLSLVFPGYATNFVTIQTTNNGGSVSTFEFVVELQNNTNSVLYMSSEINNRYLYLDSNSTIYNLANDIEPFSVWPMMHPGETVVTIDTTPLTTNDFLFDSISYVPTYWGL